MCGIKQGIPDPKMPLYTITHYQNYINRLMLNRIIVTRNTSWIPWSTYCTNLV